jgi:hypothetical protein
VKPYCAGNTSSTCYFQKKDCILEKDSITTPFKKENPEDIYKKYHSAFIASVPRFEYYVTDVVATCRYSSVPGWFPGSRISSYWRFITAAIPWLIFENWQERFIFAPNEHVTGSVEDFLFVTMVYFSSVVGRIQNKILQQHELRTKNTRKSVVLRISLKRTPPR